MIHKRNIPSLESGMNVRFIRSSRLEGRNCQSQSQSYITTDGQSASLSWCQAPIWDPRPIFLLLSLIILRQLRVCWCWAPSLTRGRICSFQLLLGLASAVFVGPESRGTEGHILLSQFFRLSQPEGPGPSICFSKEQGIPVISQAFGRVEVEFHLNNIYKYSSYLRGNTLRLRYRDNPVNAV
jgi:hypothetical protein